MRRSILPGVTLLAILSAGPVHGFIEALYSLGDIIDECTHVFTGTIESVDPAKKVIVAAVAGALKGGAEYRKVQMAVGIGPGDQARYLLDQVAAGDDFILFYQRQGYDIKGVCHAGDTWFQLQTWHDRDWTRVWWQFNHLEPYLGRTFHGTTVDLIRVTDDAIAGRRKPPPPNPRVPALDWRNYRPRLVRPSPALEDRVLVARGDAWKYLKGTGEASGDPEHAAWRAGTFDDAGWESGRAPLGYGDGPFGTELADMRGDAVRPGYTSVFLRRRFRVDDPEQVREASLEVDYDDGFIAWLNGREVAAANRPAGNPAHNRVAAGQHESGAFERFAVGAPRELLRAGENVLAVQVFNAGPASSDLKLDLELRVRVERAMGFRRLQEFRHASPEPRGISWADVNGDDALDIFVCLAGGDLLLLNDGDSFRPAAALLGLLATSSRAAAWADFDGDDHPDLLTNDYALYRNAGGRLVRVNALRRPEQANTEGAGWIDCNYDGLPDVLITDGEHGIRLFENTGSGPEWFRDASERAGLGRGGFGAGNGDFLLIADLDGDGFQDFLYNLGAGLLARNNGVDGAFAEAGAGIELPGGSGFKRGIAPADFDGDGLVDLLVPGPQRPRLYRNGDRFTDVLGAAGDLARSSNPSFSAAWGDVDLDGTLDLFVCRLSGESGLYLGDGKGKFRDATAELGLRGLAPALAASFADVDADGDLDLAVTLADRVAILANELPRKPERGALRVRIQARRGLIGCVVRAHDQSGQKLLGLRELNGAEGCGGQAAPIAHFGVPAGTVKVTAMLSDGRVAERTVEVPRRGSELLVLREKDFER